MSSAEVADKHYDHKKQRWRTEEEIEARKAKKAAQRARQEAENPEGLQQHKDHKVRKAHAMSLRTAGYAFTKLPVDYYNPRKGMWRIPNPDEVYMEDHYFVLEHKDTININLARHNERRQEDIKTINEETQDAMMAFIGQVQPLVSVTSLACYQKSITDFYNTTWDLAKRDLDNTKT